MRWAHVVALSAGGVGQGLGLLHAELYAPFQADNCLVACLSPQIQLVAYGLWVASLASLSASTDRGSSQEKSPQQLKTSEPSWRGWRLERLK